MKVFSRRKVFSSLCCNDPGGYWGTVLLKDRCQEKGTATRESHLAKSEVSVKGGDLPLCPRVTESRKHDDIVLRNLSQ